MNGPSIIFPKPTGKEPTICVDCKVPLVYIEQHLDHPKAKHFLVCPQCRGHYKARADGTFLSSPADRVTRSWRARAHSVFETLTRNPTVVAGYRDLIDRCDRNVQRTMTRFLIAHRRHCYQWLAEQMGLAEAHFGLMNIAQCRTAIAICEGVHPEEIVRWHQQKKAPKRRKPRAAFAPDIEEQE